MTTVFKDGKMIKRQTLAVIRQRLHGVDMYNAPKGATKRV